MVVVGVNTTRQQQHTKPKEKNNEFVNIFSKLVFIIIITTARGCCCTFAKRVGSS
jgi:hypothetical protein